MRIAILEDSGLLRSLLRRALEAAEHSVVAESHLGRDALLRFPLAEPEVLLLDLGLPDVSGLSVGVEMSHLLPDMRVVVLSDRADPFLIDSLPATLRLRWSYLLKKHVPDAGSLLGAIAACTTTPLRDTHLATPLLSQYARFFTLDEGKQQILDLLAQGASNATIARTMHLSVKTVEYHLSDLYTMIQPHSRKDVHPRVMLAQAWKEFVAGSSG